MNKTQLAKAISEKTGLDKKQSEAAIDAALEVVTETLVSGEEVRLQGFGNFVTSDKKAGAARNPAKYKELIDQGIDKETAKTQSSVNVPASRKPKFKPGKNLIEAVK